VESATERTTGAADGAVRIGVVTVSDRVHGGEYEDESGPAVLAYLERALTGSWQGITRVVPDEAEWIRSALVELADREGCCLIVTTGGTGPAPRDVTPEAVESVCTRTLPGLGEAMRAASRDRVPTAVLARQVAGVRGISLVLALPGSPRAVAECLDAVFAAVPHAVRLIGGPRLETAPEIGALDPH
jgi:molybdopterin adenylyltransferase